jgi:23S rRNA (cytidine1920-2'-O)/16S rRNA (cytidine1409-2'-O)-methyltransferase
MAKRRPRERLDVLLVERELAQSRAQAQRLIRAGLVSVGGQLADKPGVRVAADAEVSLQARPRFVSRGGEKLEAALERFALDVAGLVGADIGASTGGFTDCLLQRGIDRVYAVDVGYGQLDWRLRNDDRVVVLERTNARYVTSLPEAVDLITIDVSFISLDLILPVAVRWLKTGGQVVALIKPQFEAGRSDVGKGGVVRDPEVHRAVLHKVLGTAHDLGLGLGGLMTSPLRGPAGNVEFLGWWQLGAESLGAQEAIASCLGQKPA